MFETELEAGLKGIKVKAKAGGGIITRVCTLTLSREFDALIANALSGAKKIHAALKSGEVTSCVLPINRVLCQIQLEADFDKVTIARAHGTKAKATAGDPDNDEPPHIDLEFEFIFDADAWTFFGRHVGARATITLNRSQKEFDLGSRAEA